MICVKYDDMINLLKEYGELKSEEIFPKIKPTHGSCCTCQDCGYDYDNCVCLNNELYQKILNIEKICIPDSEDHSYGKVMGEKIRTECNKMTSEERAERLKRALGIIYNEENT